MTDKTAKRVERTLPKIKERTAVGLPVAVEPTPEVRRVFDDLGCDLQNLEQYRAVSMLLLNAHFTPRYEPSWVEKKPPKWTKERYALLLFDFFEVKRKNKNYGSLSICKELLQKGRGRWRGLNGTGVENLRQRVRIASNDPAVLSLLFAKYEKIIEDGRRAIKIVETYSSGMQTRKAQKNQAPLSRR